MAYQLQQDSGPVQIDLKGKGEGVELKIMTLELYAETGRGIEIFGKRCGPFSERYIVEADVH